MRKVTFKFIWLFLFMILVNASFTQSVDLTQDWGKVVFGDDNNNENSFTNFFNRLVKESVNGFKDIVTSEVITIGEFFPKEYKKVTVEFPEATAVGYYEDSVFGLAPKPYPAVLVYYYFEYDNADEVNAKFNEIRDKLNKANSEGKWTVFADKEAVYNLKNNNSSLSFISCGFMDSPSTKSAEITIEFSTVKM